MIGTSRFRCGILLVNLPALLLTILPVGMTVRFLLDIQVDPAIVDRLGLGRVQTAQRFIEDTLQFGPLLADGKPQLILVRRNARYPKVGQPQAGNGIADCRNMSHHDVEVAVGQGQQPFLDGRHRIQIEIGVVDQ